MSKTDTTVSQEQYWEKHGMPRMSLHRALAQLELSLKRNQTRGVLCLVSDAGWGKSQSINGIARKHGYRVVDVRTSQFTLLSAGVPQRVQEGKKTFEIAVPDLFPTDPDEKVVFLFDEINQGQEHAVSMFFQLLEDRRYLSYQLPKRAIIVALMNPSTANYKVSKIETNAAFRRRIKFVYVYLTYEEWVKHAKTEDFHHSDEVWNEAAQRFEPMKKACHPWVLKYLGTARNMLYTAKERDTNQQFACPATWQTVSLDLWNMDAEKIELNSEFAEERVASSIGVHNAKNFIDYIRNNEIRIAPEEILEKYTPKSKLREKVRELMTAPGGGIADLAENLARYLFESKPDPAAVAPRLALFWSDLPDDWAQAFYGYLGTATHEGGGDSKAANIKYMQALTTSLTNEEGYAAVNARLNRSHDAYATALKGGKTAKDPMA